MLASAGYGWHDIGGWGAAADHEPRVLAGRATVSRARIGYFARSAVSEGHVIFVLIKVLRKLDWCLIGPDRAFRMWRLRQGGAIDPIPALQPQDGIKSPTTRMLVICGFA